ncbi:Tn3 family transposase [Klebsiella pneumoniae]|uniref:Tn3 family transposase n=1 Tax=Klebsiella pneumoniae TaxID=573 RepID=UPI0015E9B958|nr:Tn3 family transposase [Klebsiella pneumoniae]MDE4704451.1 Tn3 family transposase [Klebsiella pneumoniae]MEC5442483.1 Tn3 family transposase [Klebsiella pneumoniae]QLS82924.1 Tn3 family transposase [Klebsiella pneumoniae]HBQ4057457.1 Tn3 family transposase [Klebsiella pneumoniae]HBS7612468.1 Tn3 family transposase [Klebsiella pneumoniae]
MSDDFLTDNQVQNYGRYAAEPNEVQLARYFHLDERDLDFVNQRRGKHNRLGIAVQLTTARFLGTFISDLMQVPAGVRFYVAAQLGISRPEILSRYAQRENTLWEHHALIRQYSGYHYFGDFPWSFRLKRLLYVRVWLSNERPGLMFDFATAWLLQHKVLLPAASTLTRLIGEIRERANRRLWRKLASLPDSWQTAQLAGLLEIPEGQRVSVMEQLRKGPVTISGPSFTEALERYTRLRNMGFSRLNFSGLPVAQLRNLARYAGMTSTRYIARMPEVRRLAVLTAFVKSQEISALDEAVDVLDMLILDITREAKKTGQKKRLRTLKDLDRAALLLARACALLLDENTDETALRKTIFKIVPPAKMTESVDKVNELARPHNTNFQYEMVEQYGRVKRFLPALLRDLHFHAAPDGGHTLAAIHYLAELNGSKKRILDDAPGHIIIGPWKRLVYDAEGRIQRAGYSLCLLERLQDALRRRDIWLENSERWGDPRQKLLQGKEWMAQRVAVCRALGHPTDGRKAVEQLANQLDETWKAVSSRFHSNDAVGVCHEGKYPSLTISSLEKLDEPPSLTQLSSQVRQLLPPVDLTELLLEIDARTGFTREFIHVSESEARAKDLHVSLCAVLLAEACNIGHEPLIKHNIPALTRHRLSWVKQNYLRAETLVSANAWLVDFQSTLELAGRWGGGEVASADGMRFVTPVKTLNAGPNRKYFGSGRGITWYNFISDQYSGFHGIVIPGTLRDSIFVLEGLLEQQTGLNPIEIMTDTAGASDIIFGLFWLLGYQFSPRLADAGEAVFWRIDKNAHYGALDELARGCVELPRIESHWDEMMRASGSLKLGTIHASELVRSLLRSTRPSGLAQAIMEVGRVNKTLYLLNYIDDEDYRRRILTQLNRGEGRHAVARAICYGQRGEIRKRYREGQEDQLGALGLVTNAVVLWNSLYMQEALAHLRTTTGVTPDDEHIARLSPLMHRHINMLGHYTFTLPDDILKGELRPLNMNINNELSP